MIPFNCASANKLLVWNRPATKVFMKSSIPTTQSIPGGRAPTAALQKPGGCSSRALLMLMLSCSAHNCDDTMCALEITLLPLGTCTDPQRTARPALFSTTYPVLRKFGSIPRYQRAQAVEGLHKSLAACFSTSHAVKIPNALRSNPRAGGTCAVMRHFP